MITEKDYEVLYYITPKKYRLTSLDQNIYDPKRMTNFDKEEALGEKLVKCSKTEFVETIVKIFKNKYANAWGIWTKTVNHDGKKDLDSPKRKDFKQLLFDFKEGVENIFECNDEYLDSLFIEFDASVSGLNNAVKTALQGKQFTETINNGKTVLEVDNSPILKIEISSTTFQMFIDKDSFIDYGTH